MSERRSVLSGPKAILGLAIGLLPLIAGAQPGQVQFDIGTGGTAAIVGAIGGSVIVDPSPLELAVTINFGELSPVNRNALVRVSVPVIVRSELPYQVTASVPSSNIGTAPDAMQLADVGVGLINMRPLARGEVCGTPHTVYPPFNTDPATSVTRAPRATYPGNAGLLGTAGTVLLSGPELSSKNIKLNRNQIPGNQRENGWQFDFVVVVAPQFFLPGSSSATLILRIAPGPPASCP